MRAHLHYCAHCGDVLYRCTEPMRIDDAGGDCANAPYNEREYCFDCCVPTLETQDDDNLQLEIGGVL